jgi:hypothetical protein
MSDAIARETLLAVPPDELLEVHSRLKPPIKMRQEEAVKFFQEAAILYGFGCYLQKETMQAGWDEQFTNAIHSGSDRLFLATLNYLQPPVPTVSQSKTRDWLRTLPPSFPFIVKPEVDSVTKEFEDPTIVAEGAEAEIQDYTAFAALSTSLEADLLGQGLTMKESSIERLGASLAGLALKRELAKSEVADLEAIFNLS